MSAVHLKHGSFLPFADVKPVSNDLVHAMPRQCMLALPNCILQNLTTVLIDHVEKKQLWKQQIEEKKMTTHHRHLSNIDCFMAHTACLVCFISTVNGRSKKGENALEDVALVVGTQQNLSNLYFLDIYATHIPGKSYHVFSSQK